MQIAIGPPPESAFALSQYCGIPSPGCPGGAATPLVAVVFHPAGNTNIAGQDVGDVLGDTMFLCLAGPNASSGGAKYAQVSMWNLQVWSGCTSTKPFAFVFVSSVNHTHTSSLAVCMFLYCVSSNVHLACTE